MRRPTPSQRDRLPRLSRNNRQLAGPAERQRGIVDRPAHPEHDGGYFCNVFNVGARLRKHQLRVAGGVLRIAVMPGMVAPLISRVVEAQLSTPAVQPTIRFAVRHAKAVRWTHSCIGANNVTIVTPCTTIAGTSKYQNGRATQTSSSSRRCRRCARPIAMRRASRSAARFVAIRHPREEGGRTAPVRPVGRLSSYAAPRRPCCVRLVDCGIPFA